MSSFELERLVMLLIVFIGAYNLCAMVEITENNEMFNYIFCSVGETV